MMLQLHLPRFCYNLIWRELLLSAKEKALQIRLFLFKSQYQ